MLFRIVLLVSMLGFRAMAESDTVPLGELKHVECSNQAGHFFYTDVPSNGLRARSPSFPELSRDSIEQPDPIGIINWVEGKVLGFGGMAASPDGARLVLVTVLLDAAKAQSLPKRGEFSVHFADTYGTSETELMTCSLSQ